MEHEVVSREEWLKRRVLLLKHEKALTKHRDLVSAERLRLPWGFASRKNISSMLRTES